MCYILSAGIVTRVPFSIHRTGDPSVQCASNTVDPQTIKCVDSATATHASYVDILRRAGHVHGVGCVSSSMVATTLDSGAFCVGATVAWRMLCASSAWGSRRTWTTWTMFSAEDISTKLTTTVERIKPAKICLAICISSIRTTNRQSMDQSHGETEAFDKALHG